MKTADIPQLKEKILKMLVDNHNKKQVTQSELWKTLGMPRRDCGKLIDMMIKDESITKTKHDNTFIIELNHNNNNHNEIIQLPIYKNKYSATLSHKGRFSPCSACNEHCRPEYCDKLDNWIRE